MSRAAAAEPEREEPGRVLYSYDVGGRTKVAVVAKDGKNRAGWGPETTASCDPAALPARYTDAHGYEIWTDRSGNRVPTTEVGSAAGAAHCDWQKAHFLDMDEHADGRMYARGPDGVEAWPLLEKNVGRPYGGAPASPRAPRHPGPATAAGGGAAAHDRVSRIVNVPLVRGSSWTRKCGTRWSDR